MRVEQILEQMDINIKSLQDSHQYMTQFSKEEIKRMYGSIRTYNQSMDIENGALTALINFRQWIVNKNSLENHLETINK